MTSIQQGDARDMTGVATDSVELVVTSPPYNLGVEYENHSDDMALSDYRRMLSDTFQECARVLAEDGRLAVNVGVGTGRPIKDRPRDVKLAAEAAGFNLRDEIVWWKKDAERSSAWGSWRSASNPREIFQHEYVLVFYREEPGRAEKRQKTLSKEDFMTYTKSVWEVPTNSHDEHPAVFPEEIPRRLIRLHSYEGDTVLDPFCGTGTTLRVARAEGREGIGIEKSEKYAEIARENVREVQV